MPDARREVPSLGSTHRPRATTPAPVEPAAVSRRSGPQNLEVESRDDSSPACPSLAAARRRRCPAAHPTVDGGRQQRSSRPQLVDARHRPATRRPSTRRTSRSSRTSRTRKSSSSSTRSTSASASRAISRSPSRRRHRSAQPPRNRRTPFASWVRRLQARTPSPAPWSAIGPIPSFSVEASQDATGHRSGRIGALAIRPSNGQLILAAAQGGIWLYDDATGTWTPKTDDQASLSMGALAIAPSDDTIIYAGTGEGALSGDSYFGNGVMKSTDGGETWTHVSGDYFQSVSISRIVVDPTDAGHLYAAVLARPRRCPSHLPAAAFEVRYLGVEGRRRDLDPRLRGQDDERRHRPGDGSTEPSDHVLELLGRPGLQEHRRRRPLGGRDEWTTHPASTPRT